MREFKIPSINRIKVIWPCWMLSHGKKYIKRSLVHRVVAASYLVLGDRSVLTTRYVDCTQHSIQASSFAFNLEESRPRRHKLCKNHRNIDKYYSVLFNVIKAKFNNHFTLKEPWEKMIVIIKIVYTQIFWWDNAGGALWFCINKNLL